MVVVSVSSHKKNDPFLRSFDDNFDLSRAVKTVIIDLSIEQMICRQRKKKLKRNIKKLI